MDIDALKAFLAIAETGSFTAAGHRVGRTQGAVSQQIKKLEAQIGRPVFERGGAGVQLTQIGRRLLGPARDVLNSHDQALSAVSISPGTSRISIGMAEMFLGPVLDRLLPRVRKEIPQTEITLWTESTPELIGGLRRGGLDLALLAGDAPNMPSVEPLFSRSAVWIGPETTKLHELEIIPVIVWGEGSDYARSILTALEKSGKKYRIAMSTKSFGGMMSAARAGVGLAAGLPENVEPGLIALGIAEGLPPIRDLTVSLARRPEANSRTVVAIRRILMELFENEAI